MAVTIVATVEPAAGNVPPRVRLDVTATAGESSVTITRQDPDNRIYPVRTTTGDPLTISVGSGLLYDYEAPFGQLVWYSSLEDPSSFAQATVNETRVWLIHPGVPVLSRPVELAAGSHMEEQWDVAQGVYWPMGRKTPVIHTDGARKAPASLIIVSTETAQESLDLKALLWDAGALLLNVPPSLGFDLDTDYIAIGAATRRRLSDIGPMPQRRFELPYQVCARPAGGSQATRTLADLLIDFGSLNDIKASYSSLLDVLAGP